MVRQKESSETKLDWWTRRHRHRGGHWQEYTQITSQDWRSRRYYIHVGHVSKLRALFEWGRVLWVDHFAIVYHILIQHLDCEQMKRTGASVDGTFSEYTVAYVDHVTPIPDGLDSADAAPIMCAVSSGIYCASIVIYYRQGIHSACPHFRVSRYTTP